MQYKVVKQVNGPVVVANGEANFAMREIVLVGNLKLLGEVIELRGENAIIQVYEDTTGIKTGEIVEGTKEPLCLILGPGMIGNVFDGVQRNLYGLEKEKGKFIERGSDVSALDEEKKWNFNPEVKVRSDCKNWYCFRRSNGKHKCNT